MIDIIIAIIVVVILIILLLSKKARENFGTSIISGLLLSIVVIALTPYIIALITPLPNINVSCENLPDHNVVVKFANYGNKEADSFYAIITNPKKEGGGMVFIEPTDKKLCEVEEFNYPDYIDEMIFYDYTSIKRVSKTAIKCNYIPQNYVLVMGRQNWMEWVNVKLWAKNLKHYEETINCSWDIVCQNDSNYLSEILKK